MLQMGADSLAGDKLGGFNLTLEGRFRSCQERKRLHLTRIGHAECARFVKAFNLPVMMLGGGGYTTSVLFLSAGTPILMGHSKNVARAWTYETAVMCGRELSEDLPYNQ